MSAFDEHVLHAMPSDDLGCLFHRAHVVDFHRGKSRRFGKIWCDEKRSGQEFRDKHFDGVLID